MGTREVEVLFWKMYMTSWSFISYSTVWLFLLDFKYPHIDYSPFYLLPVLFILQSELFLTWQEYGRMLFDWWLRPRLKRAKGHFYFETGIFAIN